MRDCSCHIRPPCGACTSLAEARYRLEKALEGVPLDDAERADAERLMEDGDATEIEEAAEAFEEAARLSKECCGYSV